VSPSVTKKLTVTNPLGIHARSAAKIVKVLEPFGARATFRKDGLRADGRSVLSILTLDCPEGSSLEVELDGRDAAEALGALESLFSSRFQEIK
jgi:phosphotransferase system HPr (HPr) family protein